MKKALSASMSRVVNDKKESLSLIHLEANWERNGNNRNQVSFHPELNTVINMINTCRFLDCFIL